MSVLGASAQGLVARLYVYSGGESSGASTGWGSFWRACTHAGEHLMEQETTLSTRSTSH